MASLNCTAGGDYRCSGSLFGCRRAIIKLRETDATMINQSGTSGRPINDFRITEFEPATGDVICVGKKEFSVDQYDIVVSELENGVVDVAVFEQDGPLIFRGQRPMKYVQYVTSNRVALPFMDAIELEDSVQVDVKDLLA